MKHSSSGFDYTAHFNLLPAFPTAKIFWGKKEKNEQTSYVHVHNFDMDSW